MIKAFRLNWWNIQSGKKLKPYQKTIINISEWLINSLFVGIILATIGLIGVFFIKLLYIIIKTVLEY